LLDLFCGAGGAAMGYHRAGFDVVGVDLSPQPNYPFEFHQGDALEALDGCLSGLFERDFDVIHASPPCQDYVQWNNLNAVKWGNRVEHPRLIGPVRERLRDIGLPYVIENVVGSELDQPTMLCGSMFGLNVRRHRLFESSMLLMRPQRCRHTRREIAVYGKLDGRRIWTRVDGSEVRAARTIEQAREAMGIDWMTWDEIKEAIPPAYTQFLGEQFVEAVASPSCRRATRCASR